jgi:transposase-like protein
MPAGQTHSDATKAAVLAALLAGQSVHRTAEEFHVPRSTVLGWKKAAGIDSPTPVGPQKRDEVAEQLVSLIRESLTTLQAQQRHFREASWLRGQSAADLAVLYGITFDKVYHLIAALQATPDDEQEPAGDAL